jgi:FAD/FMN-containing dehydrogenase
VYKIAVLRQFPEAGPRRTGQYTTRLELAVDQRPEAIAPPRSARGVAEAVNCARRHDLRVTN